MRCPRAGSLVVVEWTDASSHDTWAEVNDAISRAALLANVRTAGWFKGVEENCLLLVCCGAFAGEEIVHVATLYRIPMGCVHKITRVHAE